MNVTDEIKARIDIVDFISRYVPLQRSGRLYRALCPFHQERTPSFIVFPERRSWRCFGACGTGGDIFDFLMRRENLAFREALELLAQEAGVALRPPGGNTAHSQRELLYEINAHAARYFREILQRHPASKAARSYLAHRGVDEATAEAFQLGYALPSWEHLKEHLVGQGYSVEQLLQAGLVRHQEERDSHYDTFRGRLIFPIHDHRGRVIGFAGRVLDDSVPKYLNIPETLLFRKSRVVYGLDKAHRAIRAAGEAVIVEGYMDVIAAHQHGCHNVVACMGTAVTAEQLRLLQRYAHRFVLALDADTAGQQATLRALHQARQALARRPFPAVQPGGGIRSTPGLAAELRVATLPPGRDPDDLLRQNPQQWAGLIQNARPLVDYYMDVVARQYDLTTAQGKSQAVTEVVALIAELGDLIESDHYIQRLSRLVHVSEEIIRHQVQARSRTLRLAHRRRSPGIQGGGGEGPAVLEPEGGQANGAPPGEALRRLLEPAALQERFLMAHLLREPYLLIWLAEAVEAHELAPLAPEDLRDIEYKEILRGLKRFLASDEPWALDHFQDTLSPELHPTLADLVVYAEQLPDSTLPEKQVAVLKTLLRIRMLRLREELQALQFLLEEAQDGQVFQDLSVAINTIRRHRHHLERVFSRVSRTLSSPDPGGTGAALP